TNFKNGYKKSDRVAPEHEAWLEADQMELFQILRDEKDRRAAEKALNETVHSQPIYYGDNRISQQKLSPDQRFVTYRLTSTTGFKGTNMPKYITESGYTEDQRARQKVGTPQDSYETYVYDTQRDTSYLIRVNDLPGILEKPAFYWEYADEDSEYEPAFIRERETIIHGPYYAPNGQRAVVIVRSMDNKDRWLAELNLSTGQLTTFDRQHDDAWIGGPGISGWNFQSGTIGWLDDHRVYFQSESTGFSHLYVHNFKTKTTSALTNGKYEILDVKLSKDKRTFYLHANAAGPHDQHFYRLSVDGGRMERLTNRSGKHEVTLSPDERQLAILYSSSNQPTELYLMPNKTGGKMTQLTRSTTNAFKAYPWRQPEIVWFPARDGIYVPARLYRPKRGKAVGPGVIFVHGAGYLQNVHNWWSTYYREYMFHNFLADQGYTVLDIDYRGSAGYGRDWRTAIYRHMGGKDLEDQIDGAKYMVDSLGLSPERLGIYGGSYGGFITLMALFKNPGVFQAGAALRSVTDWAHYN
ncbi:MAG: prolyl oligopeptidase family serine peptidase, partial [Bacteroidota bacterium]